MKVTKLAVKNIKDRKKTLLRDIDNYIEHVLDYQKAIKAAENELIELAEEEKLLEKFLKEHEQ